MKKSSIAVIGLFFLLYILPLGVRPVIIPDEARYAEIPREMIVSEDWVVPHLNGLRYFEKPALGYWVNAASIMLFGENAFAIRLPSVIATGISALMVFFLMRRFAGGDWAGIFAVGIFLACLEVYGVSTFSVLDSLFSMFVTSGMVSFFFAHTEGKSARRTGFLFLFGAFCGLAFLTKGFIAFALPVVTIVPFLIWEGRCREFFRITWLPVSIAILVALPWAVMIHLREPDFWHFFFWNEHIRRFMSDHPQHAESFWYFVPVFIGGALPWTALIPSAILGVKESRPGGPLIRFAVYWLVFPFLFFSASHGKLGTYILPCFPPFAVLMTIGLRKYIEEKGKRSFTLGTSFLAVVTGILATALVVVQVTGFMGFNLYGPSERWKCFAAVAGLMAWSGLLVCSLRSLNFKKQIVLYSAAPLLFMFSVHFIMPDLVKERKAPGEFLLSHANRIRPDSIIVTSNLVRTVCWFYRRDDVYLLVNPGELDYGLGYDDAKGRLLSVEGLKRLIEGYRGQKKVILITRADNRYVQYRSLLPKPAFEDIDGRFVFARF